MTGFRDDMTLAAARGELRSRVRDGETCPCCKQFAKVYRRKINSGMARSLIAMYRLGKTRWIHLPTEIGARSREEGKLVHWGLVEEERVVREDGGRAGYWRVTQRGSDFVLGVISVSKYVLLYDGRKLGEEGEAVGIRQALGDKFDYRELMYG